MQVSVPVKGKRFETLTAAERRNSTGTVSVPVKGKRFETGIVEISNIMAYGFRPRKGEEI